MIPQNRSVSFALAPLSRNKNDSSTLSCSPSRMVLPPPSKEETREAKDCADKSRPVLQERNTNHIHPGLKPASSTVKPMVEKGSKKGLKAICPELNSYWCTTEATRLFSPRGSETPDQAVDSMIDDLHSAFQDEDFGEVFGKIVEGGHDEYKHLTADEVYKLATKCRYVHGALVISRDTINRSERFSFQDCCTAAAAKVTKDLSRRNITVQGSTIARWYREFRRLRVFHLPIRRKKLVAGRQRLALFFRKNPTIYATFMHYMDQYLRVGLEKTSASLLGYDYFVNTLLPIVAKERGYHDLKPFLAASDLTMLDRGSFELWFLEVLALRPGTPSLV